MDAVRDHTEPVLRGGAKREYGALLFVFALPDEGVDVAEAADDKGGGRVGNVGRLRSSLASADVLRSDHPTERCDLAPAPKPASASSSYRRALSGGGGELEREAEREAGRELALERGRDTGVERIEL